MGSVLLLVLAASAVVALAAGRGSLLRPPAELSDGWTQAVRVLGAVVLLAGLTGLLVQRKHMRAQGVRGADPGIVGFQAALTVMATVWVVAAVFDPPVLPENEPVDSGLPAVQRWRFGVGAGTAEPPPMPARGGDSPIRSDPTDVPTLDEGPPLPPPDVAPIDPALLARAASILVPVLLLFAVWVLARRMMRSAAAAADLPVAPEQAEAGLEASLAQVARTGTTPRDRITTAYRHLLAALASAGAAREPYEAPHEHLHRTLGPLGIRPEPLHRLAELYVIAQFSERPVTEQHRTEAAGALELGLVDLRREYGAALMGMPALAAEART